MIIVTAEISMFMDDHNLLERHHGCGKAMASASVVWQKSDSVGFITFGMSLGLLL